jgi:hypothetical protein
MTWGVRATVGYAWDNQAIELSGWWLGLSDSFAIAAAPNSLSLPFNNFNSAVTFPKGFEGDNGMWLQADLVRASLQTSIGNGEINYRWGPHLGSRCEWLVGLRYMDLQERLGIYTGDDDLTVVPADPFRQATYAVWTHNRLLMGQLGFEGHLCVAPFLELSAMFKGAWGVNFVDIDTSLQRGDGFPGPSSHFSDTTFGHMYEIGVFADWIIGQNIRIRSGYEVMWLLHVADPVDQVNFDLSNFAAPRNVNGSVFFQGPVIEVQVMF